MGKCHQPTYFTGGSSQTDGKSSSGAEFDFEMVFDFLEKDDIERFYFLISGLNLLEDDYLGEMAQGLWTH